MSSSRDAMSCDADYARGGQTPACSSRAIAWSENSACGASPPMTNIRIESWFGSPLVTFSKRRIMPGGNDTTSRGSRSTYSTLRSEEHTSELQSQFHLVCRLLLEKKK